MRRNIHININNYHMQSNEKDLEQRNRNIKKNSWTGRIEHAVANDLP